MSLVPAEYWYDDEEHEDGLDDGGVDPGFDGCLKDRVEEQTMLLKMNINHRCPVCGKVRFAYMGAGWVRRDTSCQNCGSTYELTRTMHHVGLQNQERKRLLECRN